MNRRRLVSLAAPLGLAALPLPAWAQQLESIDQLKPGDFTWHPDREPTGPLAVIVSIPQQLVHVYRNGIRIAVSTCSTGRRGHETPTGVFVILQKDKDHHSSLYDDASMPNMNRLTWSGIALHAGQLPGYPASHGCVRLPLAFSQDLFTVTQLGTPVIIAGGPGDPWELTHPGLVLGGYADQEFEKILASHAGKAPTDWTAAAEKPFCSLIASGSDKAALLLVNGEVVARGTLTIDGAGPIGDHVFILQNTDGGLHWGVVMPTKDDVPGVGPESVFQRVKVDPAFATTMQQNLSPGMIAVLTDLPLTPDTRTGSDFVIMTSPQPKQR